MAALAQSLDPAAGWVALDDGTGSAVAVGDVDTFLQIEPQPGEVRALVQIAVAASAPAAGARGACAVPGDLLFPDDLAALGATGDVWLCALYAPAVVIWE